MEFLFKCKDHLHFSQYNWQYLVEIRSFCDTFLVLIFFYTIIIIHLQNKATREKKSIIFYQIVKNEPFLCFRIIVI